MPIYNIVVKPGSSQEKIVENDNGELIVFLHARAHDGEANAMLIKNLAEYFDIPKTTIRITRGSHSRHKTIEF